MTNNLYLSFGGLEKPSFYESLTALYIVIIGYNIKDRFYRIIFMINGLTATLAHSPYFDKHHPKLRKIASYIDGASIYYALFLYYFKFNKTYALLTMLIIDLLSKNSLYKFMLDYRFLFMLPSIIKIIKQGILYKSPFIVFITLYSKFIEEKYILKSKNKIP